MGWLRADTTVVPADIKYPTDSGLLTKGITRLATVVARLQGGPDRRAQILQARDISELPSYAHHQQFDDDAWWDAIVSLTTRTSPPSPFTPCLITVRSKNPGSAMGTRSTKRKLDNVTFTDTSMWETPLSDTANWPTFLPAAWSGRSLGITADGNLYVITDDLLHIPGLPTKHWQTSSLIYAVRGRSKLTLRPSSELKQFLYRDWTVEGGVRQMHEISRTNQLLVRILRPLGSRSYLPLKK